MVWGTMSLDWSIILPSDGMIGEVGIHTLYVWYFYAEVDAGGAAQISELHDLPEAILKRCHLSGWNCAYATTQTLLCHRSDLITHRHCRLPITGDRDEDRRAGLRRT